MRNMARIDANSASRSLASIGVDVALLPAAALVLDVELAASRAGLLAPPSTSVVILLMVEYPLLAVQVAL